MTAAATPFSHTASPDGRTLPPLREVTGVGKEPVFKKHYELDALAGGWSKEEANAFQKNTQVFERIDEDVWK